MNTSIKGKESEGEGVPPQRKRENPEKRGEEEGYDVPRTLSEDLDPTTRTNGRLS